MFACTRIFSDAGRRARAAGVVVAALAVFASTLVPIAAAPAVAADQPPAVPVAAQRDDDVVTADALPTVQIDSGVVWAQATIGTTVYAVGSFKNARAPLAAPGTQLTPRSNILAYDITTGQLLPFAPQVNGVIRSIAASPDGSRIYIGGSFNQVNGQTRWTFAALDAQTGQLIAGFSPSVGGSGVYAIAATSDRVYVGGLFTQANGVARKNLAAFSTTNGALQSWAPTTDLQVDAMVMEPGNDRVVVAGRFSLVNGATQRGLAAIQPTTGALDTSWAAPNTVVNGWGTGEFAGKSGIYGLAADDSGVYGTGWVYAAHQYGNLEGTFAAERGTGAIRWIADCHGDTYGVYSTGATVYTTSHNHSCSTIGLWPEQSKTQYRYVGAFSTEVGGTVAQSSGSFYKNWGGSPAPTPTVWFPDFTVGTASGLGQAGLTITGSGEYISVAGEFTSVNNQRYQGIVRFATNPASGAKEGPRSSGADWQAPTAISPSGGFARVTVPSNWDRDDRDLTYELLRDGQAAPVTSRTVPSLWWTRSTITLDDVDAPAGESATYTVRVSDGDGNAVTSTPVTVQVSDDATSAYAHAVLADSPSLYYPLGPSRTDWASGLASVAGSGLTNVSPGAVPGVTGQSATRFAGTTSGRLASPAMAAPTEFSVEMWFQTTTQRGGKLVGYGNSQTGSSSYFDRHVYMRNDGRLTFGVYPNRVYTVTSDQAYNDGDWHHVVATSGADGIAMYVDGQLVGSDAAAIGGYRFNGYWRFGGDTVTSGWPSRPASNFFAGTLDEVAVYPSALTLQQVQGHWATGSGQEPPTAAFQATPTDLVVAFDGSSSAAANDATISTYAWDFGDGQTGTGATTSHTYAAAGTYTATLTVTDDNGLQSSTSQQVSVLAANVQPQSAFVTSVAGLAMRADGSSSTDQDGTIASYAWDFGDGTTANGAVADHTYAADGTYAVSLTVTDDRGGASTSSQNVSVAAPQVNVVAADTFARDATAGWGSAETGGAYTVLYGSSASAVVAGGVGTLSLAPGQTRNMQLNGVSAQNVRITTDISLDAAPTTGSAYAGVVARQQASGDNYTVRTWLRNDGSVWLVAQRGGTVITATPIAGIQRTAGASYSLAVEIEGSGTTNIRARLWQTGTPEPTTWQLSTTDQTAALQGPGAIALHASRASSASGAGIFSFDNLRATQL